MMICGQDKEARYQENVLGGEHSQGRDAEVWGCLENTKFCVVGMWVCGGQD